MCKETFGEYRGIAASWKSPLSQECHSKFTLSQRVYFTSVYSCCAKELASETKGSREGAKSRIPAEDPSYDFSSADKPLFISHILTPLPSGVSIKGNTVFYGTTCALRIFIFMGEFGEIGNVGLDGMN